MVTLAQNALLSQPMGELMSVPAQEHVVEKAVGLKENPKQH